MNLRLHVVVLSRKKNALNKKETGKEQMRDSGSALLKPQAEPDI